MMYPYLLWETGKHNKLSHGLCCWMRCEQDVVQYKGKRKPMRKYASLEWYFFLWWFAMYRTEIDFTLQTNIPLPPTQRVLPSFVASPVVYDTLKFRREKISITITAQHTTVTSGIFISRRPGTLPGVSIGLNVLSPFLKVLPHMLSVESKTRI